MLWCFKLSYGPLMKLQQLKSACRNRITSRNNSLYEWKKHSPAALVIFYLFLFFFRDGIHQWMCKRDVRERRGRLTAINLRLPFTYTPPTTPLPARPCSTSLHSFRPGPGGEETAAPSGIWHHNYIGSRTVCRLLELERLQAAHTCPLMCTEQLVNNMDVAPSFWHSLEGKIISCINLQRVTNNREWLPAYGGKPPAAHRLSSLIRFCVVSDHLCKLLPSTSVTVTEYNWGVKAIALYAV